MFPSHSKEEIQDVSYDLESHGLLEVLEAINAWEIRLRPEAYKQVDHEIMGCDPREDAANLAKLMIEKNEGDSATLQNQLGWSKRRFNPAQRIIVDDGCVSDHLQADYVVSWVDLTPESRAALGRFVKGH